MYFTYNRYHKFDFLVRYGLSFSPFTLTSRLSSCFSVSSLLPVIVHCFLEGGGGEKNKNFSDYLLSCFIFNTFTFFFGNRGAYKILRFIRWNRYRMYIFRLKFKVPVRTNTFKKKKKNSKWVQFPLLLGL